MCVCVCHGLSHRSNVAKRAESASGFLAAVGVEILRSPGDLLHTDGVAHVEEVSHLVRPSRPNCCVL